jgi:hypothetical protein
MPFRRPLTAEDLRQIQARYRPLPEIASRTFQEAAVWRDVYALLSEIKRLRATVLRVHQLRAGVPRPVGCLEEVWQELMQLLDAEPCVVEREGWTRDLLNPSDGTGAVGSERNRRYVDGKPPATTE